MCTIASDKKFRAYGLIANICIHCPIQLTVPNFLDIDMQWMIIRVMFSNLHWLFAILDLDMARLLYVLQEKTLNCTWSCSKVNKGFFQKKKCHCSQNFTLI